MRLYLIILYIILCLPAFSQEERPAPLDSIEGLPQDSIETATVPLDSVEGKSLRPFLDSLIDTSPILRTSQLGLMVYDLDADSTLYAHNHRQLMRPASIMKVITAITALDRLGGAYQFKTRLRYTGEIIDSTRTLTGDVYIIGGMDPRVGKDDLVAFAESLRALGIDTIRGRVCMDKSMKESALYGEGWCWDDDNPMLSACVYNRKDDMGERFLSILGDCGVYLDGELTDRATPAAATELCSRSHSIDQILQRMIKDSNNLYAEAMFYNMAYTPGRTATASAAKNLIKNLVKKLKLRTFEASNIRNLESQAYRFADGSGLSLYNYVTAELEVAFLRYAYLNSNIYEHFYPALPIAAKDGTLEKRMKKTSAAGNVHAKTGTLTGISSLAGYATARNGHTLAFCIINQGIMNTSSAKTLQDKICIALTSLE